MNEPFEFLGILAMLLLGIATFITVIWESKKRQNYHNDERWHLIVSRGNQIAYNVASLLATVVLLVLILSGFGFLQQISGLAIFFQQQNLFRFLWVMGLLTPYALIGSRVVALVILDKRM